MRPGRSAIAYTWTSTFRTTRRSPGSTPRSQPAAGCSPRTRRPHSGCSPTPRATRPASAHGRGGTDVTTRHQAPEAPDTVADRFRDAIAPRTLALGVGVLLLQFAFILSYIGAFHSPSPHRIPVTVVAPPQVAGQVVDQLNAVSGQPVVASASEHEIEARQAMRDGETSAVDVVRSTGHRDTRPVASERETAA